MGVQLSQPLSLERRQWFAHKVVPMFSPERIQRLAPGAVLDIVAELEYWKSCYPYRTFFHNRLPFDAYVPTFKFGYGTFLLHHKQRLADVLPKLEQRYAGMPQRDRLDWKWAAPIVRATWKRMDASGFHD